MKHKLPSILNLGLASIITIFIVLTMSVFAALSLLTARSDYSLSQRTADRVTQVYETYNRGESLLKDIDDLLIKSYNNIQIMSYEAYCSKITASLDTSHLASYTLADGILVLTADITVNDTQALHIELTPAMPESEGDPYYTINQWKIRTTKTWEKDDSLRLLE